MTSIARSTDAGTACDLAAVLGHLDRLEQEIKALADPNHLALQHLGKANQKMGGTDKPYADESFRLWNEVLAEKCDDAIVIHHLAIMHHARAIDREAGDSPADSNEDWGTALNYWHQLWQDDAFWDHLIQAAGTQANRQVVDDLRDQLPGFLLAIHDDIAFEFNTETNEFTAALHRAAFHIKLAAKAPFSDKAKAAVRGKSYQRFIESAVPGELWNSANDAESIARVTDPIRLFLKRDSACVPALVDALRMQRKLASANFTEMNAAGNERSERTRALLAFKRGAADWKEYFDQLVKIEDLDEVARENLGCWYSIIGQVHLALEDFDTALGYFEKGAEGTRTGENNHKICIEEAGDADALIGRKMAKAGERGAKAHCDRVRRREVLSSTGHFVLANAYRMLDEFDLAEEVCRLGIEASDGSVATSQLEDMLESIRKSRSGHALKDKLDKAAGLLKAGSAGAAIRLLDEVLEEEPSAPSALFLRCQSYLMNGQKASARDDLAALEASDDQSEELRQAIASLRQHLD